MCPSTTASWACWNHKLGCLEVVGLPRNPPVLPDKNSRDVWNQATQLAPPGVPLAWGRAAA
jgi:hypothetical protein